jgi:hypothetical protein
MSVQQPVLTPPHGGETVTSSGGELVPIVWTDSPRR